MESNVLKKVLYYPKQSRIRDLFAQPDDEPVFCRLQCKQKIEDYRQIQIYVRAHDRVAYTALQ